MLFTAKLSLQLACLFKWMVDILTEILMVVSQPCIGYFKLLLEGIDIEVSSTLTLLR